MVYDNNNNKQDNRTSLVGEIIGGVVLGCLAAILIAITFRLVRWIAGI